MEKNIVLLPMLKYAVPADFETFLEEKAKKGYQIDKLGQFNFFHIKFIKEKPKTYRYVMDLNTFPNENYKNTYLDFGWELVGQISSCFIWRKEYDSIRPESFSDHESIIKRNKRVRNAIGATLFLLLLAFIIVMVAIIYCHIIGRADKFPDLIFDAHILGFISFYLFTIVNKIQKNIDKNS